MWGGRVLLGWGRGRGSGGHSWGTRGSENQPQEPHTPLTTDKADQISSPDRCGSTQPLAPPFHVATMPGERLPYEERAKGHKQTSH